MRFHRCALEIVARSPRSPIRHLGFAHWFVDTGPDPGPKRGISTAHAQPVTGPVEASTPAPVARSDPAARRTAPARTTARPGGPGRAVRGTARSIGGSGRDDVERHRGGDVVVQP